MARGQDEQGGGAGPVRTFLLGVLGLLLAACASGRETSERAATRALWREVPVSATVFTLPDRPGGDAAEQPPLRALTAFRKRYDNGWVHRVILANTTGVAKENRLLAHVHEAPAGFFESMGRGAETKPVPTIRPDSEWLDQGRRQEFPGMRVVTEVGTDANAYGPYNYTAVTNQVGETCLLAWQILDEDSPTLPRSIERFTVLFRFCHHTAGERALRDLFERVEYAFVRGVGGFGG